MTPTHSVRLLARATFSGRAREAAMDVVRAWADVRAHKSIACGLYGVPSRVSVRKIDPTR